MFAKRLFSSGIYQFFENPKDKQFLPLNILTHTPYYGRSWRTNELRAKSFEDLHKLWWVLLKERNVIATLKCEMKRVGFNFTDDSRDIKCRLTMARIKTVLTERMNMYRLACALEKGGKKESFKELAKIKEKDRKDHFHRERKWQNFKLKRSPLFY